MKIAARVAIIAGIIALQAFPLASLAYGGGGMFVPPVAPQIPAPQGQVLGVAAYNFANHLAFGDTGQDVIEIQQMLIADGYLNIPTPTGYFGPLTLAAVKAYQAANGIEATGFVGDLTLAVLNKGTPVAVAGNGSHWAWVNALLNQLAGALQGVKTILAVSAST